MGDVSQGELEPADVAALFDRNRLRIARELRGLTQVELAREVGTVTSASLSQFENGHSRPSSTTLRRLSIVLRVPVGFFVTASRLPQSQQTQGFFRSLRSTIPRDRLKALAHVDLVHELTLQLERYVALPELDLPRVGTPISGETTRKRIEQIAADVRERWNIPRGPIQNVVRELERHGIVTTRFRVELDQIDAFSVLFLDHPVVVLGADKGWRDRSRFDGAHELAHLVMHLSDHAGSKLIETQAHQFAAAFLMPADDIKDQLPSCADWPHLLKLKNTWHVSIAALLMRAKTLEVMDEQVYVQAMKVMSARGWRKREPGDLGSAESPVLLRRAVDVAADNRMALSDIVHRAGLPEGDIRTILGAADDERPRVEL